MHSNSTSDKGRWGRLAQHPKVGGPKGNSGRRYLQMARVDEWQQREERDARSTRRCDIRYANLVYWPMGERKHWQLNLHRFPSSDLSYTAQDLSETLENWLYSNSSSVMAHSLGQRSKTYRKRFISRSIASNSGRSFAVCFSSSDILRHCLMKPATRPMIILAMRGTAMSTVATGGLEPELRVIHLPLQSITKPSATGWLEDGQIWCLRTWSRDKKLTECIYQESGNFVGLKV